MLFYKKNLNQSTTERMTTEGKKILHDLLIAQSPTLLISGEIDNEMRCYIENSIAYLRTKNNPPLQIVIDSGGGSVAAGLDIYDLIRLYPGETFGIVYSRASSMATIVLQACTKRQCARHAEILIHHVSRKSVSLDSLKNPAKLSEIIQDMEKDQSRLYKILCDKTEKSEADIASECEKDTPMSAEDALEFRLIDEII